MALWRGWKGEAEEAIRIKGRFCQHTCRSASRKAQGKAQTTTCFVWKKVGWRVTVTAMHGPRGKQLPRGNNYCTMRAPAEVRNNLLFITSKMYVCSTKQTEIISKLVRTSLVRISTEASVFSFSRNSLFREFLDRSDNDLHSYTLQLQSLEDEQAASSPSYVWLIQMLFF